MKTVTKKKAKRTRHTAAKKLPHDAHTGRQKLPGVGLIVAFVLTAFAFLILTPSVRIYLDERRQITELSKKVSQTQENVAKLTKEQQRWKDKSFIMTQARERLSYVVPGEVSFLIVEDVAITDKASERSRVSKKLYANKSDWLSDLLVSAMTVGLAGEGIRK